MLGQPQRRRTMLVALEKSYVPCCKATTKANFSPTKAYCCLLSFGPTTILGLLSLFLKSAPMHSLSMQWSGKLDYFMATTLSRSAALSLCQAKLTALLQEHLIACEAILRCDIELKWRHGP
jgi:hypothetical protein